MPIPPPDDDAKSENHDRMFTTEQLNKIYPVAKTYEDRRKDRQDREARRLKHQPRHLALSTATRLFILAALVFALVTFSPILLSLNGISGMFNIALCALLVIAIIKWQVGEISAGLYSKGLNDTAFFTLYLFMLTPLTSVALYQANRQTDALLILVLYTLLFLVHFICTFILIRFVSRA